jgi:hypothetical protein
VRDALGAAFVQAAVFVETVMTIWKNIPIYSTLFGVAASMLLFFFSALIGKMDTRPSQAK